MRFQAVDLSQTQDRKNIVSRPQRGDKLAQSGIGREASSSEAGVDLARRDQPARAANTS